MQLVKLHLIDNTVLLALFHYVLAMFIKYYLQNEKIPIYFLNAIILQQLI